MGHDTRVSQVVNWMNRKPARRFRLMRGKLPALEKQNAG
jgi:hypothetical protein